MSSLRERVISFVGQPRYQPVPAKALARKMGLGSQETASLHRTLKELVWEGRLEIGKRRAVQPARQHGSVAGLFRKLPSGAGIVRPRAGERLAGQEIFIPAHDAGDASTGDEVLVRIQRASQRRERGPRGTILRILERLTQQFVGTYVERGDESFVVVDGTTFHEPIYVGDPGAKGAKPDDKVVFEMIRFPNPSVRAEGVITEVLGPRGKPGVDLMSILRAYDLPDHFPPDVLDEARRQAATFDESDLAGRTDFTKELCVTIDPPDAHDFDDAIGLAFDVKKKHWLLQVHIADVGYFAPPGSHLDREAKARGTSVYLPGRVIPMFPELISNSLASLQEGKVRYVQSVLMEFDAKGEFVHADFVRGAIRVRKRLSYDQVSALLAGKNVPLDGAPAKKKTPAVAGEVLELLGRLRDFARVLRTRRRARGSLELDMPEVELEYDDEGRVTGGHLAVHDESHQMVEECMLAANEAVAGHLDRLGVAFLRRNHDAPNTEKLEAFLQFAKALGYEVDLRRPTDRFQLQRLLAESAETPQRQAIHYALLRSLKQANYGPDPVGHYALASRHYCHFTSPIRRYPDLTVHRLLEQWQRNGHAGSDEAELTALGEHCSFTERRGDRAEQDLVKLKLLMYLSTRIGSELDVTITGVEEFGFFAQAQMWPVEGRVHVSTLPGDDYYFDVATYSLVGRRTRRRFRLGDTVRVKIVRVDLYKLHLDFRLVDMSAPSEASGKKKRKR